MPSCPTIILRGAPPLVLDARLVGLVVGLRILLLPPVGRRRGLPLTDRPASDRRARSLLCAPLLSLARSQSPAQSQSASWLRAELVSSRSPGSRQARSGCRFHSGVGPPCRRLRRTNLLSPELPQGSRRSPIASP